MNTRKVNFKLWICRPEPSFYSHCLETNVKFIDVLAIVVDLFGNKKFRDSEVNGKIYNFSLLT